MITISLKDACRLLDAAWYVTLANAKGETLAHNSYGYSEDPEEDFLTITTPDRPEGLMKFIEKDNAMVVLDRAIMRLVNEAGATMELVLFITPNQLEGLRIV
jgi:hypothetical protein